MHDRRTTEPAAPQPAAPSITVTEGGLAFAVLTAPTLRPRLNVIVRAGGRHSQAIGRSVDLGPIGLTRLWLVVAGIVVGDSPVERVAVGRSAKRAEAIPQVQFADLVRDLLARQAAGVRAQVVAAAVAAAHDLPMTPALSRDLRGLHDAMREHLHRVALDPQLEPGIAVEVLARLDASSVYVRGWIGYLDSELTEVTLVSPEGERIDVGDHVYRFDRDDVAEFYGRPHGRHAAFGFACTVTLRSSSLADDGWLVQIETRKGALLEASAAITASELGPVREIVMADLVLEALPSTTFRAAHIWPAITHLQDRALSRAGIASVDQLGDPPDRPRVSVIVPLYRRIDFVEHQLAQFAHDPQMLRTDLIYVLDSPELADAFRSECKRLHRLYRVPFRAVVLQENVGFSGANNAGVSLAHAPLLLLMNSDVLPDDPGWLDALADFLDADPTVGAVAPKLLFEDDSLQHAGLYFDRPDGELLWQNEHYFKGLHGSFPAANIARPVPAITAACMLLPAALYRSVGGLLGQYVQGDFEDSDLCLRLRAVGLRVWYVPQVQLYHLEGQSYPTPARITNGHFNRWLHTHLWNDEITALMSEQEGTTGPTPDRTMEVTR